MYDRRHMNIFYCSCELCMALKDISVALRMALALTPQQWKGEESVVAEYPLSLCVAALTLFSLSFHARLSPHTDYLISLPAVPCRIILDLSNSSNDLLRVYRHQHVCFFYSVKAKIVRLALHFLFCVSVGVTETSASRFEKLKMWLRLQKVQTSGSFSKCFWRRN